jgi:hypothetical protein
MSAFTRNRLKVPRAILYYEVRGHSRVLPRIAGGSADAALHEPMAIRFVTTTVVALDRGATPASARRRVGINGSRYRTPPDTGRSSTTCSTWCMTRPAKFAM